MNNIDLFNADVLTNVAEVTVQYSSKIKPQDRLKIMASADAHNIFRKSWDMSTIDYREECRMLVLNRANQVVGIITLSTGGSAGTVVDPKMIFQTALLCHAQAIILCHNHPSGNTNPSKEDLALTARIKEAGKLLDINLLDHIILTATTYRSMADQGEV